MEEPQDAAPGVLGRWLVVVQARHPLERRQRTAVVAVQKGVTGVGVLLPVVRDGRPIGLISRADLVRWIAAR